MLISFFITLEFMQKVDLRNKSYEKIKFFKNFSGAINFFCKRSVIFNFSHDILCLET